MDEPLKAYLLDLDRAIVARGGQSVFKPNKPAILEPVPAAFNAWEREKLTTQPLRSAPEGYVWRTSKLGITHLMRRP